MNTTGGFNESVSIEQSGNGEDREKYIADMINIIGRPILIVFGTIGEYIHLS